MFPFVMVCVGNRSLYMYVLQASAKEKSQKTETFYESL